MNKEEFRKEAAWFLLNVIPNEFNKIAKNDLFLSLLKKIKDGHIIGAGGFIEMNNRDILCGDLKAQFKNSKNPFSTKEKFFNYFDLYYSDSELREMIVGVAKEHNFRHVGEYFLRDAEQIHCVYPHFMGIKELCFAYDKLITNPIGVSQAYSWANDALRRNRNSSAGVVIFSDDRIAEIIKEMKEYFWHEKNIDISNFKLAQQGFPSFC